MKARHLVLIALALVLGSGAYWRWSRPAPLGESDFLLLGELSNRTGDPNFDGSLQEAVRVSLSQSPFLNLVTDEKARATLTTLGTPADTPQNEAVPDRGADCFARGTDRLGQAVRAVANGKTR
jgi:hypothetical protein